MNGHVFCYSVLISGMSACCYGDFINLVCRGRMQLACSDVMWCAVTVLSRKRLLIGAVHAGFCLVRPSVAPPSIHNCLESVLPSRAVLATFHLHGQHVLAYLSFNDIPRSRAFSEQSPAHVGSTGLWPEQKRSHRGHSFLPDAYCRERALEWESEDLGWDLTLLVFLTSSVPYISTRTLWLQGTET